jgi:hypothetical protein
VIERLGHIVFGQKVSKIDARNMLLEVFAGGSDTDYFGLEFGMLTN